jgi:concentrative nucleoside transporter, CNT family
MQQILWGLAGSLVVLAAAWALSTNRRAINWRTVGVALVTLVVFAFAVLRWSAGRAVLEALTDGVNAVINSANAGIQFLFGPLIPDPREGIVFALQVLPVIVFFASLMAVLYHLRIMQVVIKVLGGGLRRLFRTSRAESTSAAANIFVGQTEGFLVIRPYVNRMTRSELFSVMTVGMATVAGSVLVGYALLGVPLDFLLAATFMTAPSGLLMAKMVVPETEDASLTDAPPRDPAPERRPQPDPAMSGPPVGERNPGPGGGAPGDPQPHDPDHRDPGRNPDHRDPDHRDPGRPDADDQDPDRSGEPGEAQPFSRDPESGELVRDDPLDHEPPVPAGGEGGRRPINVFDAAARGAEEGLRVAATVGALLIAFISLIALLNVILGGAGDLVGVEDLTFQRLLGYAFAPVAFVIGVPWSEATTAGSFLGQKLILNEFVAFTEFGPRVDELSDKTVAVVTFALCGFANFGSFAILLGGLAQIAPRRRGSVARLGVRAVLAGTLANLLNAAVAGMFV